MVSFRTLYLPCELVQLTIILVYVPGPNKTKAAEHITECFTCALMWSDIRQTGTRFF